jgi:uncharacterized repeat protein (TIGR01451 family)
VPSGIRAGDRREHRQHHDQADRRPRPDEQLRLDTDTVVRSANLSITRRIGRSRRPGQAFTYTLTVTNGGLGCRDALGLGLGAAQFTVTNVTSPAGACGFAGQVVTCTRPTLANAATWVITVFVTTAAARRAERSNTAAVSRHIDPVPANNSASQNTTISVSADLAVTKTDGVASVVAGTSTDYTITLTNNGPSAVAAGVVVSDPVPGHRGIETEPNCAIAAGTFTCTTTAVLASGTSVVYHRSWPCPPATRPPRSSTRRPSRRLRPLTRRLPTMLPRTPTR